MGATGQVLGLVLCLMCGVLVRAQVEGDLQDSVEELCDNRPPQEFFRLTAEGDCRDVVRCDRAGIAGTIRLASIRCPSGLAFDLDQQICDWKAKVTFLFFSLRAETQQCFLSRLITATSSPSRGWPSPT